MESTLVVPKPDVLALAEVVPAVVESIAGAVAVVLSVVTVVLVALESTVTGVVTLVVSVVVVLLSVPLLQAARLPAIAIIRNAFFIVSRLVPLEFTFLSNHRCAANQPCLF